jgi:hypothetical protein
VTRANSSAPRARHGSRSGPPGDAPREPRRRDDVRVRTRAGTVLYNYELLLYSTYCTAEPEAVPWSPDRCGRPPGTRLPRGDPRLSPAGMYFTAELYRHPGTVQCTVDCVVCTDTWLVVVIDYTLQSSMSMTRQHRACSMLDTNTVVPPVACRLYAVGYSL